MGSTGGTGPSTSVAMTARVFIFVLASEVMSGWMALCVLSSRLLVASLAEVLSGRIFLPPYDITVSTKT